MAKWGANLASEPEILNRVRKLRFEHGEMTQEQLAQRVGVTRQTIIAIESGKYLPSLPLAFRLAAVFGQRVDDVFTDNSGFTAETQRAQSGPSPR